MTKREFGNIIHEARIKKGLLLRDMALGAVRQSHIECGDFGMVVYHERKALCEQLSLDRNEIDNAYVKVDLGKLDCHYTKPPLGLMPKYIHNENRMDDIKEAVKRMFDANNKVNIEWIEEYNELCGMFHLGGRDEYE